MYYRKNIYTWEQGIRIVGGLALIIVPAFTMQGGMLSYNLIAAGVGIGHTGVFGFCPMCALAGRRIAANLKAEKEGK